MKFKFLSLIVLAAFFFTGASPWEGAAVTAPEGELPGSGLYVATNSFPRNTVIEIINLENSKSVRAIVANTLDSPGILAIVSRQAAELIGMRQGSVSRIRILQPSEPIAYSRFAENAASGVADFSSGNVITEENYFGEPLPQPPEENTYSAEETLGEKSISDTIAAITTEKGDTTREIPEEQTMTGSPILLEPEWNTDNSTVAETTAETEPSGEHLAEAEPEAADVIIIEELFEPAAELTEESEETDIVAEIIIEEDEPAAELADSSGKEVTEYEMIPAEDRPPENVYDLPKDFLEGIGSVAAAVETKPEPAAHSPNFSVQSIPQLSGGQFYVQLTAVPAAEPENDIISRVENAVSRIPPEYKPFAYVHKDNSWYRVLLGAPLLNEGESAAILQRVRSIGFKDAFVQTP